MEVYIYMYTGELGYDRLNGTRKIGPSYAKSVVYIWRILDMHRTGTKHIVRHMQTSVVQWCVISKFTCIPLFVRAMSPKWSASFGHYRHEWVKACSMKYVQRIQLFFSPSYHKALSVLIFLNLFSVKASWRIGWKIGATSKGYMFWGRGRTGWMSMY